MTGTSLEGLARDETLAASIHRSRDETQTDRYVGFLAAAICGL
jgi:hypothetical protein